MTEEKVELERLEVKDVKIKDYYKMEDIVKLDEEKVPLIAITMDKMFKAIFMDDVKLLKKFILSQLPLELEEDEVKLQLLNSELPVSNIKEYRKIVDIIVSLNDNIFVNLEVNRQSFYKIKNRNYLYKNSMINQTLKSGDKLKILDNIYYYQINLNVKDKKDEYDKKITKGTRTICTVELESQIIYLKNEVTFIKYLEFYRDLYYNKGIKLTESEMWLVMLTSKNYKELYETLGYILDKDTRNSFIRKVIELSNDKFFMDDWNEQIWEDYFEYLDEQKDIERKKQDEERRKQDEERKKQDEERKKLDKELKERDNELKERDNELKERDNELKERDNELKEREKELKIRENDFIINMINNNIDIETISKITNLTIEEIIKIKDSL